MVVRFKVSSAIPYPDPETLVKRNIISSPTFSEWSTSKSEKMTCRELLWYGKRRLRFFMVKRKGFWFNLALKHVLKLCTKKSEKTVSLPSLSCFGIRWCKYDSHFRCFVYIVRENVDALHARLTTTTWCVVSVSLNHPHF